ncbi:carbohydrate ABC transporter permease [Buttiauxella ferragutiae]|uniref:carbohydrate ABC transporter permease n=1 Tax=Buttiauxella ferragutiae TaxID=82989 RepID=UPI001E5B78EA|nr:sugar ABC transporter permease [Buttiauxella ferragutiae]MCE0828825.1 sugar ABC transporter permease [Buttiauxella ferragutiae]
MSAALFSNRWLPLLLPAPLLLLMVLFFYLPVFQSIYWSFFLERPFGGGSMFVGWENFARVLGDDEFWSSLQKTLIFTVVGSTLAVVLPLVLALAADRHIRLAHPARNVLIWPKAVAGASIGVVFHFLFNPFVGLLAPLNSWFPELWNPRLNGTDAFITLLIAHTWGGIPFNFMILLAGLQAIPRTLHQAAAMDGAGPWRRILDIQLPFILPQLFLTLVIEFTESVTSGFALVDTMTEGGPGGATNLLVYKIYVDGFKGYDLSGAATQTTLLMLLVLIFTAFQFLYLERRVKYER